MLLYNKDTKDLFKSTLITEKGLFEKYYNKEINPLNAWSVLMNLKVSIQEISRKRIKENEIIFFDIEIDGYSYKKLALLKDLSDEETKNIKTMCRLINI